MKTTGKRYEYWLSKDNRIIEIAEMKTDYLCNVINFVYTQAVVYNHKGLLGFIPVLRAECKRRGLSFESILKDGTKAYVAQSGLTRIWDEETNQDITMN